MSNNINGDVLLVGAGCMAAEYSRVLETMGISYTVVGRSRTSAEEFQKKTNHFANTGGLAHFCTAHSGSLNFQWAIVASNADELAANTCTLLRAGVKNILVEKPAGLHIEEIARVDELTKQRHAHVFVAYNRRFYASVQKVRELIERDGGVSSFQFDFTEWSNKLVEMNLNPVVLENLFYANSTHVVDLAFFLGGKPKEMCCFKNGSLAWHPAGASFCGAGQSQNDAPFSYQANWESAGRWGVEINTTRNKYILCPLEKLQIQKRDSIQTDFCKIADQKDIDFKPGLFEQVAAFLKSDHTNLKTIEEQRNDAEMYNKMLCMDQTV